MVEKDFKEKIKKIMAESEECPVCSIAIDYEFDMLAKIQYDITHDESLRAEVAKEGGFCDFHFKQFKRIANFKTSTLLLQSILENGFFKNITAEIDCRICKTVNQIERDLINDLAVLFNDVNFRNKFEKSNGVCAVHLKDILKVIDQEELKEWLIKTHREQIERFKPILEELNSANSYWNIEMSKREFVNLLIQKFAGRKTAGV